MLPVVPDVPLREALLLLPDLPAEVTVVGDRAPWEAALAAWGLVPTDDSASLAVGGDARALARSGAELVLLQGADRTGALNAAGYRVTRWQAMPTRLGAPAVLPTGDGVLARLLRTGGGRRRPKQVVADLARRLQGPRAVTVGVRTPGPPLVLRSLAAPTYALLVGQASARRRPVFLVTGRDGGLERVVKVGYGDEATARAQAEREVLQLLERLEVPGVPRPLGSGGHRGLFWTVETALPGVPLMDALRSLPTKEGLRTLERVADRLTDLALRTRGPLAPDRGLRLLGEHVAAARALPNGLPGVLVHGDLAANALLGDGPDSVQLLDWETARTGGLPLHDLLPVLCSGLAAVRGVRQEDAASLLLPALRGSSPDSAWLLGQVRRHLALLEVPGEAAGALAGTALASWASLRLAHDELVRATGREPAAWSSPADALAAAWRVDPDLGTAWQIPAA